jgi:hypothetical protein
MYAKLYNFSKLLNMILSVVIKRKTASVCSLSPKKMCHYKIQNLCNSLLSHATLSLSFYTPSFLHLYFFIIL